jgi:hypothetical protein
MRRRHLGQLHPKEDRAPMNWLQFARQLVHLLPAGLRVAL